MVMNNRCWWSAWKHSSITWSSLLENIHCQTWLIRLNRRTEL